MRPGSFDFQVDEEVRTRPVQSRTEPRGLLELKLVSKIMFYGDVSNKDIHKEYFQGLSDISVESIKS